MRTISSIVTILFLAATLFSIDRFGNVWNLYTGSFSIAFVLSLLVMFWIFEETAPVQVIEEYTTPAAQETIIQTPGHTIKVLRSFKWMVKIIDEFGEKHATVQTFDTLPEVMNEIELFIKMDNGLIKKNNLTSKKTKT